MEWIILPTTHLASSTFCVWVVDLSNIGISSDPEALWSLRSRNGDGFEWEVVSEGFQLACLHSRSNPICSLPETVDFVWWSSCWERNYVQTGEDNCLRTVKGHIFLGIVGAPCHIQSLELTKSLQEFLGSDLLYRVLQVLLIWEPQAQHESTNLGGLWRYLQQVAVWRVSWANTDQVYKEAGCLGHEKIAQQKSWETIGRWQSFEALESPLNILSWCGMAFCIYWLMDKAVLANGLAE